MRMPGQTCPRHGVVSLAVVVMMVAMMLPSWSRCLSRYREALANQARSASNRLTDRVCGLLLRLDRVGMALLFRWRRTGGGRDAAVALWRAPYRSRSV